MIAHKQQFRHRPEQGEHGDCMRTVIASLLELDPGEVPHEHRDLVAGEQDAQMNAWLSSRGMAIVSLAFPDPPQLVMEGMAVWNPGQIYMLSGRSRSGFDHVVIARDAEIIHDPHPDNVGLTDPDSNGLTWVGLLVPTSVR